MFAKTGYKAARRRVCEMIELAHPDDKLSHAVDVTMMVLILVSVIAVTLESLNSLHVRFDQFFSVIEVVCVLIFSAEYLLRLWSCVDNPHYKKRQVRPRLAYVISPMAIVDFLAVLPFYLVVFGVYAGSNQLLVLRALRLLRVLKLTRYSTSFAILTGVIQDNVRALTAALFLLMIIMLIAATGIFAFEHEAQPVAFGSIPAAMWWAFATLTTVGYGDVTPITVGGKIFGASITVVGLGMVALPTAILASAFSEQLRLRSEQFSSKVDKALDDGVLTTSENHELEVLRNALGISPESAQQILAIEYSRMTSLKQEPERVCPHCAHAVDKPPAQIHRKIGVKSTHEAF